MPNPDIAGLVNDPQFKGLAPAQQREALHKVTGDAAFASLSDADTQQFLTRMSAPPPGMTQQQKGALSDFIATGKKSAPGKFTKQPYVTFKTPRPDFIQLMDTVGGAIAAPVRAFVTPPQTPAEAGIANAAQSPAAGQANLAVKRMFVDPQTAEWQRANETEGAESVGHRAASLVPLVGPMASQSAEDIKNHEYTAAGVNAAMALKGGADLGAGMRGAGKPVVETAKGVPESLRSGTRSLLGMGERATERVAKAELGKHAEAMEAHGAKVAAASERQAQLNAAAEQRTQLTERIHDNSTELGQRLGEIEQQVRQRAQVRFQEVEKATQGDTIPADSLSEAVRHAESNILKGSSENIKQFRELVSKGEGEPVTVGGAGEGIGPGHPLYEQLKASGAIAPPEGLSFRDLQGYYSELGMKMRSGGLPGDVYNALKFVRNQIGTEMSKMAQRHNALGTLQNAKTLWADYETSFHDMSPVAQGGSPLARSVRAVDPQYIAEPFTGKAGARAIETLRRYDPKAAALAQQIAADHARLKSTPAPKGTQVAMPKPPEAPNLVRTIEEARQARLDRYVSALRSPLAFTWEVTGALAGLFTGHGGLGGSIAGGAAGLRYGLAQTLDSPRVYQWLTEATPKDVARLQRLSPEAQTALRQTLGDLMQKQQAQGQAVAPSPAVQRFLTPKTVAKVATTTAFAAGAQQQRQQPSPNRYQTPDQVMLAMKSGQLSQQEGNRLLQSMRGKSAGIVRPLPPPK